jgi:hypothetical protein
MKTALILLIGNRDVQVPKQMEDELKNKIAKHLVPNNEGKKEYLVINKSKGAELNFLEASKLFFEEIEYLHSFLDYPMLNSTLKILNKRQLKIDKILLTSSKQNPPHFQDSFFFAEILAVHLKKMNYTCEIKLCSANPNNFPKMVSFYSNLFDEVGSEFEHIIVSNSGGTPTMRSASHFAGIFRGYDYITINSSDEANLETFKKQEELILRNIVQSMLKVFDYEGILQLPIVNQEVQTLCKYALARIALNFSEAKEVIKTIKDKNDFYSLLYNQLNVEFRIQELEIEMYYSAKIKFRQKSYSDYLWRLFTIYENIFLPYAEKILDGKIIYNKKSNFKEWNDLLTQYELKYPGFKQQLTNVKIGKNPLDISMPSKYAYRPIVEIGNNNSTTSRNLPPELFVIADCLEELNGLRNAAAHNYKGFGLNDINSKLPKKLLGLDRRTSTNGGAVKKFNEILGGYFNSSHSDFGIYQKINDQIQVNL